MYSLDDYSKQSKSATSIDPKVLKKVRFFYNFIVHIRADEIVGNRVYSISEVCAIARITADSNSTCRTLEQINFLSFRGGFDCFCKKVFWVYFSIIFEKFQIFFYCFMVKTALPVKKTFDSIRIFLDVQLEARISLFHVSISGKVNRKYFSW